MIIALVPRPTTRNGEKTRCDAERCETMTDKEAMEIIKIAIAEVEWDYPMDYTVAFEKAMEALEKRIPKKAYKHEEDYYVCPNCDCQITWQWFEGYCEHCGQAIDWSDEE